MEIGLSESLLIELDLAVTSRNGRKPYLRLSPDIRASLLKSKHSFAFIAYKLKQEPSIMMKV
jgi:hypothetical protein